MKPAVYHYQIIMKKLIFVLFLLSSLPACAAGLSVSDIHDLLSIESSINSYCRGISPDSDEYNHPALCCDETKEGARDKIGRILKH